MQLVHLLHRHVLEAARHRRRELLVEAVLENALRAVRRRRLALHQLVPGELQVQHHRVHLSAWMQPGRAEDLAVDARLAVAERLEPEAVRQAPRGVDGQDQGALPCHGGAERERRGRRGLSHSARTDAAQDASAGEHLVERGTPAISAIVGTSHEALSMARATLSTDWAPKERSNR